VNVLKPHRRIMVETLLSSDATHREIERRTGVDRKTIRRYARAMVTPVPNSSTPATIHLPIVFSRCRCCAPVFRTSASAAKCRRDTRRMSPWPKKAGTSRRSVVPQASSPSRTPPSFAQTSSTQSDACRSRDADQGRSEHTNDRSQALILPSGCPPFL
jgi:hypothetical protein